LNAKERHGKIKIIPKNSESFIQIKIGKLIFKDSANFLLGSLEKLVESSNKSQFFALEKYFRVQFAKTCGKDQLFTLPYILSGKAEVCLYAICMFIWLNALFICIINTI
jgi:hypothetical protein